MARKNKFQTKRHKAPPKKDLEKVGQELEKTGEVVGDFFKGLFKGMGRILDVAREMEEKGEKEHFYKKEIKGFTKSGKEFRGQAGWRVKTGLLESGKKRGNK